MQKFPVCCWMGYPRVPNLWNQTHLVPSPSIKKRGESVGWLPEQGKDGITSLSLLEQPDCTCISTQKILINVSSLINSLFGLFSYNFKQYLFIIQHFKYYNLLFLPIHITALIQNGVIPTLIFGRITTTSTPVGSKVDFVCFILL